MCIAFFTFALQLCCFGCRYIKETYPLRSFPLIPYKVIPTIVETRFDSRMDLWIVIIIILYFKRFVYVSTLFRYLTIFFSFFCSPSSKVKWYLDFVPMQTFRGKRIKCFCWCFFSFLSFDCLLSWFTFFGAGIRTSVIYLSSSDFDHSANELFQQYQL